MAEVSAPKKGQYGEPFRTVYGVMGYLVGQDENDDLIVDRTLQNEVLLERVKDCLNALDGRNPEKLQAVIEAAKLKQNTLIFQGQWVSIPVRDFDKLRAALRDFGEEV